MSAELLLEAMEVKARAPEAIDCIEWLVDNAQTYQSVLQAINAAQRTIWISQLAFDADCMAYEDGSTQMESSGHRLIDSLIAASTTRGVSVRMLLNASLLLDTASPLRRFLQARGATGIDVRGIRQFPQLLHSKMMIVDGRTAFLIGSPFVNGYWDDSRHNVVDKRRPERELGGRPLHDLSCLVKGPAVRALESCFAELWNDVSVSPHALTSLPVSPADHVRGGISVARTAPRRVLSVHPDGCTEILTEMLDGLAAAQSLVYIEHQYLSARPVIRALVAALRRQPALEVIVVLNQNPDVTAYRGWQNTRIRESGLWGHPRVGFFALWTMAQGAHGERHAVNQIFVHSKVLVVDDHWATVGSANLDGVSLHSYGDDFESAPLRQVFRNVRNFDVNLVLDDRNNDLSGAVRELRTQLWSEHLALDVDNLRLRPADGWLAQWRAQASCNVAALSGGANAPLPAGFVMPYSMCATPREQLADLGIDPEAIDIHFDPGWLEVHCSPNWVRNMFA